MSTEIEAHSHNGKPLYYQRKTGRVIHTIMSNYEYCAECNSVSFQDVDEGENGTRFVSLDTGLIYDPERGEIMMNGIVFRPLVAWKKEEQCICPCNRWRKRDDGKVCICPCKRWRKEK